MCRNKGDWKKSLSSSDWERRKIKDYWKSCWGSNCWGKTQSNQGNASRNIVWKDLKGWACSSWSTYTGSPWKNEDCRSWKDC